MSIIAAGTTTTTALSSTGNTDGTLQLQVNGTTPSVTLNTLGAIGVGSTPAFGTSGQVLTSAGSTAAPSWSTNVSSQWTTTGSDIYYTTGNVAIGTSTPSSTSASGYRALELGTSAGTGITAGNGDLYINENTYVNGGAWKYAASSIASAQYNISGGVHRWYTAPSGTAGNNITWTQVLGINASGAIGVGSSPSYGTSGQVLTSAGSGAAPTWATPAAGGSLILVNTATGTNVSQVDLTSGLDSTYPVYKLYVNFTASSSTYLVMQFYLNSSLKTSPSAYYRSSSYATAGSNYTNEVSSGQPAVYFTTTSGRNVSWEFTIFAPTSTTRPPLLYISSSGDSTSYNGYVQQGMCGYDMSSGSGALTGFRFSFDGSSVSTFAARLYGIKT